MIQAEEPLTIADAAAAIRAGTLTPAGLLDQCLARIDRSESLVRAWVVVDRDGAREQAERLTDELRRGHDRGPLHGIPIGVKDIIDVFDLPTGCGSKRWADSIARQDAAVVRRLRQAGAVILGKTVTTPFAFLDPPVTRNPWDPSRTPGGSSSGSAAALACGMCLAALGTQTVGSLTRPASYCGVCSLKPSYGAVSCAGLLPLAPTLDHVGVMARCITDLAILAEAVLGDNQAPDARRGEGRDCVAAVGQARQAEGNGPEQFDVLGGLFEERAEPVARAAFERVINCVRAEVTTAPRILSATLDELSKHLRAILAFEAAGYHGPRLHRHPDDYPPKIRALIEEGLKTSADDYQSACGHRLDVRAAVDAMVPVPVHLLSPAAPGPAPDRGTTGDAIFSAPWSYTGHPTVSLPVGWTDDGLPLAVQLVGRYHEEARLLAAAAWLEGRLKLEPRLPPAPGGSDAVSPRPESLRGA